MSTKQERLKRIYKLFFFTAIVAVVSVFSLDYYYDHSSPTVPSEASGHIYPLYDKYHSRYVYVTKAERACLPFLICIGVACVFSGVYVDRKINGLPND